MDGTHFRVKIGRNAESACTRMVVCPARCSFIVGLEKRMCSDKCALQEHHEVQ